MRLYLELKRNELNIRFISHGDIAGSFALAAWARETFVPQVYHGPGERKVGTHYGKLSSGPRQTCCKIIVYADVHSALLINKNDKFGFLWEPQRTKPLSFQETYKIDNIGIKGFQSENRKIEQRKIRPAILLRNHDSKA